MDRILEALDRTERLLLDLGARLRETVDEPGLEALAPRETALALSRAALREGDTVRLRRWLTLASATEAPARVAAAARRIDELAGEERSFLGHAVRALADAGRVLTTPADRAEVLALAADAARRRGDVEVATSFARFAAEAGPATPAGKHARFLLERMARP
jgi:hypothetical protein